PFKVQVVDRDDCDALKAERKRVLEVREVGPEAAKEPRERPRHADFLRPGGKRDRLDSCGNEVGPAGDRGEAHVRRDARQLLQEVPEIRLLPGPVAPENVCVEDDHATASYTPTVRRATSGHPANRRGACRATRAI